MKTKFIIVIALALISACAPKIQEQDQKSPQKPELLTHDTALQQIYKKPFASFNFATRMLESQKIYSQINIQNLFEIEQQLSDQNSIRHAIENLNKNAGSYLQNTKKMDQLYYLQLVEEQTKESLKKAVTAVEKKILADTEAIEILITNASLISEHQPRAENTLRLNIESAQKLTSFIILQIQKSDFLPELKKQIPERLNTESSAFLNSGLMFDTEYLKLSTLTEKLSLITEYLKKLHLELDSENQSSILTGQQFGLHVDRITNPQTALQALAFAWKLSPPDDRLNYFQKANQSLYDLFNKKTDKEIQCLIDGNCSGLIEKLILELGVYPELEKYGPEKIQLNLNEVASVILSRQINSVAFEKIAELPKLIKKQIRSSVEKNIGAVQKFKDTFKLNLATGLQKKLNSKDLNFYVMSNTDKEIRLQDQLTLMANDFYSMLRSNSKETQLTQLILIEKVTSLLDFSNNKKNNLKNGLAAFLKNPKELFLLSHLENSTNTLNVKDQAQTLKFLSQMINATADWKPGPFDKGITDIKVQDLISDFKSDQLNQSLFPRVGLFNICFSYAVQILKQIQSQKSLVYLVDNKNQRIPIMDYLSGKNHPAVALSAASDQKNNRSSNLTRTSDLALLIDALTSFSVATKGLENSKSTIALNPDLQNQIAMAQKNIKLLVVTLANFISSQMVGPKNLVDDTYNFETQALNRNYRLSNQVHAISALLKAYDLSGIDLYLLSAKELYYSLNKNYFDPELKFYKNALSDKANSGHIKDDLLNTLNRLIPLRKHLSLSSQVQFDRIFENWYIAVLQ